MKHHLKRIYNELFNNQIDFPYSVDPTELSESTQHLLSAYIEAALDGKDAAALFPTVHTAIATYPAFAEEHQILYELLDAERRGELEEPPFMPVFDFSYLNLPAIEIEPSLVQAEARPWHLSTIGNLVIQFSDTLIEALQSQQMQLVPARSTRGVEAWHTWLEYTLPLQTEDLEVAISAKHTGGKSEYCNIVVNVNIPSRGGWPFLAESQVQLSGQAVQSEWRETDAFGEAVFEFIKKTDVPHLIIEVNPVNN